MADEPPGIITLSSDVGWPHPAAMRGVIAARSGARLIDVTHDLPPRGRPGRCLLVA